MNEFVLSNANIVLADEVILGSLCVQDGLIVSFDSKPSNLPSAVDCDGDYVLPGLIDIHTDNVEKHFLPRPGVRWLPLSAILSHDAQVISSGITTVFNAIAVGSSMDVPERREILGPSVEAIRFACSRDLLRADHRLHMRCEITDRNVLDLFSGLMDDTLVGIVSVMDHSPGQRQSPDIARYREKQIRKLHLTFEEADRQIANLMHASVTIGPENRRTLAALALARALPLASHDDGTVEDIDEAVRLGAVICEFPTTLDAAEAARARGLSIVMGSPNVMRGGSQSGNVGAIELAQKGQLNILASDYIPISLLQGAFRLARIGMDLPAAVRMASLDPAKAVNMSDRGEISAGKRADLVRVREIDELPVVKSVWSAGARVY
ncbi:MAG: alpha-D-ribose 1-methylphosphonate 5-triphosphate diphosphatase [Hyphomicrobiales bacterium]|nr:alpha-D-ribose 1-methylphosphonate 5-triphosphate diphosphatase [Hyphomicrobiales bacterium]